MGPAGEQAAVGGSSDAMHPSMLPPPANVLLADADGSADPDTQPAIKRMKFDSVINVSGKVPWHRQTA